MSYEPEDGIQPPSSLTVDHDHTPRLYLADGTPLVRRAGFTVSLPRQTPPEQTMKKRPGKRKC